MNAPGFSPLDARARAILEANDRGGYTLPTKGLYPYQWNWDSAFAALGFARFDLDRAWTEIETLFDAQWPTGMVPHIVFRHADPGYFPGPGQWGTHNTPPTSGITQPPVAATIVRLLLDQNKRDGRARALGLLEKLDRWHDWFRTARDPEGRGLVAIIHPWESGRDNLPDWDVPLSYINTSGVGDYKRRDTQHIGAEQRPEKIDYDRYMALVQFGRSVAWDDTKIAASSPFWVADIGISAILLRAEKDLAFVANALGETDIAARASARADKLNEGIKALWDEDLGGFVSLDLRRGVPATALTAGTFLALYAGAASPQQVDRLISVLDKWLDQVTFAVPSFDPGHPLFDHIRYWRGPVWAVINWMIADGLTQYGRTAHAGRVRTDTQTLIEHAGFSENFSPLTGAGAGGGEFTWTAALWLSWTTPSAHNEPSKEAI